MAINISDKVKKNIANSSLFFSSAALLSLIICLITLVLIILSLFTTILSTPTHQINLYSTLIYSGISALGLAVLSGAAVYFKKDTDEY